MLRKLFCLMIFVVALYALEPYKSITTSQLITSMQLYNDTLYVSTSNGKIEIYNIKTNAKIATIKLDNITDYLGESIPPKIFQTHTLDGKSILIVSQDSAGGSKISLYKDNQLSEIIQRKAIINKAYFIDNQTIIIGLLSNEILLYSLKDNQVLWSISPSEALFSDLIVNKDSVISTTEGGVIYKIDLKNGNITHRFEGANFDNVYMLSSAKNIILTAGRDKICGIYNTTDNSFRRLETEFLSYAVGISQDSTKGAVSFNENNDILVFDTANLHKIEMLNGGDALPNTIIFIDNYHIIASFDSKKILFWKLGEKE